MPAEFVWCASWLSHGPAPHDPHAIPQLPHELWGKPGQRAWQYAAEFGNQKCQVLGQDVDINVADVGCLASAPGGGHGAGGRRSAHSPGRHALGASRLQGEGRAAAHATPVVRALEDDGRPYLDGPRGSLGPEAEAALKAFQSEHRLDADGIYGPDTAIALARAIQLERARRQGRQKDKTKDRRRSRANGAGGAKTNGKSRKPAATLRELIAEVRRLDAETDRAWQRLAAYGATRRRLAEKTGPGRDPSIAEITAILRRMEHTLESLVDLEQREFALEHPAVTEAAAATVAAAQAAAARHRHLHAHDRRRRQWGRGGIRARNGAVRPGAPRPAHGRAASGAGRSARSGDRQIANGADAALRGGREGPWRARTQARADAQTTPTTPKETKPKQKERTEKKPRETRRRKTGPRAGGAHQGNPERPQPVHREVPRERDTAHRGRSRGPGDQEANPPGEVLPRLQGRRAAVGGRHAEAPQAHGASSLAAQRQPGEARARSRPPPQAAQAGRADRGRPPRAWPCSTASRWRPG